MERNADRIRRLWRPQDIWMNGGTTVIADGLKQMNKTRDYVLSFFEEVVFLLSSGRLYGPIVCAEDNRHKKRASSHSNDSGRPTK